MLFNAPIIYLISSAVGTVLIIAALSCGYQHLQLIENGNHPSYQNEFSHGTPSIDVSRRQDKIPNFKLWKAILMAAIVITSLNLSILYSTVLYDL